MINTKQKTRTPTQTYYHYFFLNLIGMITFSSAVMVDGYFLGNYSGAGALASVNLVMPVMSVFMGIGMMLSIGGSVRCGKFIGEKKFNLASESFTKTMIGNGVIGLFIAALSLFGIDFIIKSLGTPTDLVISTTQYLRIILFFVPISMLAFGITFFLKVDGNPKAASIALTTSAIVNIILDWLLVAKYGMGVQGAAIATGSSYIVSLSVSCCWIFSKNFKLKFIFPKSDWMELARTAYNGFSEFISEISGGIIIFIFNRVMAQRIGVNGIAAFTVVNYILFCSLMIAYTASDALQPLVSKSFGKQQPDIINSYLKVAILTVFVSGILTVMTLWLFPELVVGIFLKQSGADVITISISFIALFWPAFIFNGPNIIFSAYFTAMHQPLHSMIISISRGLFLPVLLIFSLPLLWETKGIYIAVPIAEFLTFLIAIFFFLKNRPNKLVQKEYPELKGSKLLQTREA